MAKYNIFCGGVQNGPLWWGLLAMMLEFRYKYRYIYRYRYIVIYIWIYIDVDVESLGFSVGYTLGVLCL